MAKRSIRKASKAYDTGGFKTLLKRATTEMLILLTLRRTSMYTYEMMNALERLSGGYLAFNTLYIAIYRLRELGFIDETERVISDSNRVRVYFSITENGIKYLKNLVEEYKKFSEVVDVVMNASEVEQGA
ncbi:MAG: PadR family transcriptional regulator [Oscillospiraceae bacterium]|jgi:PadR family transcriptional regulator PadR|nr:PadR family transcriptional regulator [Oscillospiraceae bacterium]